MVSEDLSNQMYGTNLSKKSGSLKKHQVVKIIQNSQDDLDVGTASLGGSSDEVKVVDESKTNLKYGSV